MPTPAANTRESLHLTLCYVLLGFACYSLPHLSVLH